MKDVILQWLSDEANVHLEETRGGFKALAFVTPYVFDVKQKEQFLKEIASKLAVHIENSKSAH